MHMGRALLQARDSMVLSIGRFKQKRRPIGFNRKLGLNMNQVTLGRKVLNKVIYFQCVFCSCEYKKPLRELLGAVFSTVFLQPIRWILEKMVNKGRGL